MKRNILPISPDIGLSWLNSLLHDPKWRKKLITEIASIGSEFFSMRWSGKSLEDINSLLLDKYDTNKTMREKIIFSSNALRLINTLFAIKFEGVEGFDAFENYRERPLIMKNGIYVSYEDSSSLPIIAIFLFANVVLNKLEIDVDSDSEISDVSMYASQSKTDPAAAFVARAELLYNTDFINEELLASREIGTDVITLCLYLKSLLAHVINHKPAIIDPNSSLEGFKYEHKQKINNQIFYTL